MNIDRFERVFDSLLRQLKMSNNWRGLQLKLLHTNKQLYIYINYRHLQFNLLDISSLRRTNIPWNSNSNAF
jgi:hypothetical protein